ncbi:MAG: hypothetical protein EU536_04740 [Promethearchaeota archaeon]|nr:MAG: hypothetical protein EU536_04740 [Candidatus Lokiarchaeota archaeon]
MSLKEIPDKIFVSLGRRGFDPVTAKQCPKCGNMAAGLELKEKIEHADIEHEEGFKKTVDYQVHCRNCDAIFYIRLQHVFQKVSSGDKRVTTMVNILDEAQNDIGWLGNY